MSDQLNLIYSHYYVNIVGIGRFQLPNSKRPPHTNRLLASMASSRSAVAKIDWTKLTSALSLTPQTTSALNSFRKRNVDAHTKRNALKASRTEVDFAHYRSVLKNQAIINDIERAAKEFTPVVYDVSNVLSSIELFEKEAVKNAQETEKKIQEQLVDLRETIKNIDQARSPDDLSVRFPSPSPARPFFFACRC